MITLQEILGGYVLPAMIVLVGIKLSHRFIPEKRAAFLYAGIAILAFALGFGQLQGWPGWFPNDSTQWILHAAILSFLVALFTRPRWWLWLTRLLLSGGLIVLLLKPIMQYDWTTRASIGWITTFTALMLLQMGLLDHLDRKVESSRLLFLLILISGATSLTLGLSGSITLAKTAGIPATMLATAWILCLVGPQSASTYLWIPFAVTVINGLWLSGHYYAELNATNALLLLSAVPMAWLGLWCKLETRPAWLRLILHALLPAIPLGIAFVRALLQFLHNETNAYY